MKFRRLSLIAEWRKAWRFWSVRLNAIGVAILGAVFWSPDAVLALWNMMPDAITDRLPPQILLPVSLTLFGAAILARVVKQEKIDA